MDPFAIVLVGGFAAVALWLWMLGKGNSHSGLEHLGLRSGREIIESRERLEAEDLDQMLAAHNRRRRARGEGEVTSGDLEMRVVDDLNDQRRRRRELAEERRQAGERSDAELQQLLKATNARRRARGQEERTAAQAQEEFGPATPGEAAPAEPPDSHAPGG